MPAKLVRRFRPTADRPVVEEDSLELDRELSREPEPVVVSASGVAMYIETHFFALACYATAAKSQTTLRSG